MRIDRRELLAGGAALAAAPAAKGSPARAPLAPTPPMGWNSWNSFATTISEAEAIEIAAIMARELLPFGYDVFTIDHQWYDPRAKGYDYNADIRPVMDGFGRFQPDPVRFPSSAGGKGFAPLAARIHALGLKFGIHRMRGIPRAAVAANLPIAGRPYRARDIADPSSVCSWNVDMYGVDMAKPGAQAYYDGVFAEYAHWGVDFVKMDDMSRPYDAHAPEIEAAHRAIARCGRAIVLSLSPGETPVSRADHVRAHAEMWRISDDFWDEWTLLLAQFTRLENWNPSMGRGRWPDADMLPLGRLALGQRDTKFTHDEQRTLMTLWAIARSPLIMGGDLRHLDTATRALLTNPAVIAVNQRSRGNQPHFVADGWRVWTAEAGDDHAGDAYLALFNTADEAREIALPLARIGIAGERIATDLWTGEQSGLVGRTPLRRRVPAHGAALFRLGPALL